LKSSSTRDLLPTILEEKGNNPRNILSFNEDENYPDSSSYGTIRINPDTTFTIFCRKSQGKKTRLPLAFFNLDKQNLSFSSYDEIEIGITTKNSRRVAVNINVQGRKNTYPFIQNHFEINNSKKTYNLPLNDFLTPVSWYDDNNVTKSEISTETKTTIQSISFEGCHLHSPKTQDQFTVYKIALKRDYKQTYLGIIIGIILLISGIWIKLNEPFKKEAKVVYIPIAEDNENTTIEAQILTYLANNYTNADLTLTDLKIKFGISKPQLSKMITASTKFTFPQYLASIRVDSAKKMLLNNTNRTISEIAYAVGFNSPSNFIRVFKVQEGISPKKYLSQNK